MREHAAVRARRPARRLAAAFLATVVAGLAVPSVARAGDDVPTQWQIDARAEALQRAPEPAEKPVICIIDTGVTPTPDLDIVSRTALDGGTPDDVTAVPGHYGHGTTVAHMAAAKVNGWGSSGVFPHARIASVRIFDHLGQRVPWQRYVTALDACIDVRPRPTVALLSIGGPSATEEEIARLGAAIVTAQDRHHINVVAAAGNSGGTPDMPARLSMTLSVAASDSSGGLCASSARGPSIDLMASGCGVDQSGWDGESWRVEGTSFSAPTVAGVLAAVRAYSTAEPAEAEAALTHTARHGAVPRLDAAAALAHTELDWILSSHVDSAAPARSLGPTDLGSTGALSLAPESGLVNTPRPPIRTVGRRRHGRLPRPTVRLERKGAFVLVRVRNRPIGALIEVRNRSRRFYRRADTIRIGGRRQTWLRFVADVAASPWVRLPIRR